MGRDFNADIERFNEVYGPVNLGSLSMFLGVEEQVVVRIFDAYLQQEGFDTSIHDGIKSRMKEPVRCWYCAREFYPFRSTDKYCSPECRREVRKWKRTRS